MFMLVDETQDGNIDFAEFLDFMCKLHEVMNNVIGNSSSDGTVTVSARLRWPVISL